MLFRASICSFVSDDTEHIISQCFHHIIDVLEPKNLSNNVGCLLFPKLYTLQTEIPLKKKLQQLY